MVSAAQPPRTTATERIEGRVERTVYHDAQSRYTVLRVAVPGRPALVTAVGRTEAIEPGAEVQLEGSWGVHPTHGQQFEFVRMYVPVPTTLEGVRRRLTRYPGIRDVIAERVVRRFGLETLDILAREPRRLLEVDGIGPRTLERIMAHHDTLAGPLAEIEAALIELDIPPHLGRAIHDRFGARALETVRQHPYRLATEVRGIAFLTADRIARALGVRPDSEERLDAGLLHVMEQAQGEGHCALPPRTLAQRAGRMLGVEPAAIEAAVQRMLGIAQLVVERDGHPEPLCFLHRMVVLEEEVAASVAEVAARSREPWRLPSLPDHLGAQQIAAVEAVANHGAVVLTGGPGTGKSTVVRNVLELARANGIELHLCAPTGRAAKRLEETTGEVAFTVHRLLEIQPETGQFTYGPGNPLPGGLVVVDESSMLDVGLAAALFGALSPEHRLLIVGDANQLPSVGPGNVLRDIVAAADRSEGAIPVVRLEQVYRQGEGSTIVTNAHRILAGLMPRADAGGGRGEFFVVAVRSAEQARQRVEKLILERIPEVYELDPRNEVQILCPMHRGGAGTEAFNQLLQEHHTGGQPEIELGGSASSDRVRRFRTGDRVMQIKNDYTRNVFNGDIGVVTKIDKDRGTVTVSFEGLVATYERKDLAALQLAYAVSIHKSQGSEFPAVVIPILAEHQVMLRRNLLYTAVTRARRLCVVVGDPQAIERAVRRGDAARRHTGLARRLRQALGVEPHWVREPGVA